MIFEYKNFAQISRLTNDIDANYPVPCSEQEALNYLYFLDRTLFDNGYSLDLIDYEKLIYIEVNFSTNKTIRQLLINVKQNISDNFVIKHKYIQRLTDDLCTNAIETTYKQGLKRFDRDLVLRGSEDFEYII